MGSPIRHHAGMLSHDESCGNLTERSEGHPKDEFPQLASCMVNKEIGGPSTELAKIEADPISVS